MSAVIHEQSGHDASGVARLWQGRPRRPGSRILGQHKFQVDGGGSTTTSWRLLRPKGDSNLWVALRDVTPRDDTEYYALKYNNYALRNVYLKALISTGRRYFSNSIMKPTMGVVGDILETGTPQVVFAERAMDGTRISVESVSPSGATHEDWSTVVGSLRTPRLRHPCWWTSPEMDTQTSLPPSRTTTPQTSWAWTLSS